MKDKVKAEEYRKPMLIKHYYVEHCEFHDNYYPLCPRCGAATRSDYQKYCTGCGQRLKWNYAKMKQKRR